LILQDHDDVKRYWMEKCCNKFKKPTSTPGDPKRDMILRCQRIQQQIHHKSASAIMGIESSGHNALSIDSEEEEQLEDEEEVAAVPGGDAAIIGNRSHTNTPTVLVDGGVGIVVAEEVGITIGSLLNSSRMWGKVYRVTFCTQFKKIIMRL
jgi:hypothetical protein